MQTNVMIVDDNEYVRLSVEIICQSVELNLISASSGEECLRHLESGFVGVILMDIMMPGMDGWDTIREIARRDLYPGNLIVMLTGMGEPDGKMDGLQEYVTDYMTKPFGPDQLIAALHFYLPLLGTAKERHEYSKNVVIIGVSTGGPLTLKELFGELPPLNAAFIVVLHITPEMDYRIAQSIDAVASMPCALARDGELLRAGQIYLAPGGFHLKLDGNQRVALCQGARVNFVQPSADVAMQSLSRLQSGKLIGIILTGMGKDGAEGLRHIKAIGGVTMAQDQKSSVIYGMPKAAVETGAVDFVLPPKRIAAKLVELIR